MSGQLRLRHPLPPSQGPGRRYYLGVEGLRPPELRVVASDELVDSLNALLEELAHAGHLPPGHASPRAPMLQGGMYISIDPWRQQATCPHLGCDSEWHVVRCLGTI